MIFVTGDTHAEWQSRLSFEAFPEGRGLTKDDFVIICGDFGVWADSARERHAFSWLEDRPFTTLFVDGNHENFNQLSAYPVVEFHGGKAHRINSSIYHLMRGELFDLEGLRCFTFGGAPSHDISDGILQPTEKEKIRQWSREGKMFRIENVSWWPQELPSYQEMRHGFDTLTKNGWSVDFVFTHDAPVSFVSQLAGGHVKPNQMTRYLEEIRKRLTYRHWFFGHYHYNYNVSDRDHLLYEQIIRIH